MRFLPLLALVALGAAACDSNPYDASQKPVVSVSTASGGAPVVSWTPAGAQLVRLYVGPQAGDGYGPALIWSVASPTYGNTLSSPVTVGVTPAGATVDVPLAGPLQAGQTYTVEVTRADPKGTGDGFTNTRNRYVGTATFTR